MKSVTFINKILFFIIIVLITGCKNKPEQSRAIVVSSETKANLTLNDLVADSIIYSVAIVNPDSLDSWNDYRLRNVNRQKFIETIFDKLYSGNLTAYNYYDETPMTIDDIKNLEKAPDFSRNRIEEIMFEETWLYSAENNRFYKEIHSIVLAYALYTDEGIRRGGLKAAFKIKMNLSENLNNN